MMSHEFRHSTNVPQAEKDSNIVSQRDAVRAGSAGSIPVPSHTSHDNVAAAAVPPEIVGDIFELCQAESCADAHCEAQHCATFVVCRKASQTVKSAAARFTTADRNALDLDARVRAMVAGGARTCF